MGKNNICDLKFFLNIWTESGRGQPLGNVRVDLPDLPLKYGPGTTSRSKVFEFTVNDFFGKSGTIHCLFPHLLFLTDKMTKDEVLHRSTLGLFGFILPSHFSYMEQMLMLC